MFISLFPLFWFSSCYSFPVLLLFFPRLVLNTCLFFPTVFLTADKTTDPASCFIFGGRATALPYCGSQTGPDFAVSLFWQEDLRRSGITRCHVSLSAMSQVLSTVEVTEPWAWHLFSEKKWMLLGILFLDIIWWWIRPIDWFSMLKNHKICFIVHHFLGKSSFTSSKSMCLMSTGGAKKGQARGQVGEDIACTCRVLSSEAGCFPQSQQTESRSRSRSRREDKFGGQKGHTWTDQEGLEYGHVWIKIENTWKSYVLCLALEGDGLRMLTQTCRPPPRAWLRKWLKNTGYTATPCVMIKINKRHDDMILIKVQNNYWKQDMQLKVLKVIQ